MRPRTSEIWQFFLAIDEDFAQCKVCGNKYSRKGRTTSSLRTHLKAMHKEIYEENIGSNQSMNPEPQGSHATISPLQRAEWRLSLAESWHKEKYEELCKIQSEQQVDATFEQSFSDTSTIEGLCEMQVGIGNVGMEGPSLEQSNEQQIKEEPLENNESRSTSQPRASEIDDVIAEMVALQNLPFSFVECIGFRRVMETALPNYQLRGSQFFTNHLCNEVYNRVANRVRLLLRKCSKLSFTTQIRTEYADVSLFNLTAHGISEDFYRMKVVLKSCLVAGRKADVVWEIFKMTLRDWNIPDENLHSFTRDKSNMIKPLHLDNISNANCPVHQLLLCVHSALKASEINDFIEKCRGIINHFTYSQTAQDELAQFQTQINQAIIPVPHDWDNRCLPTLSMLEWLLKNKDAYFLYATKNTTAQVLPNEWLLLGKIIAILRHFEETIRYLGHPKTIISSVIPMIEALKLTLQIEKDKTGLNEELEDMIKNLVGEINIKFGDLPNNILYSLATYLDPRYKLKFFNEINKEQVKAKLLSLLAQYDETADTSHDAPAPKKCRSETFHVNKPSTSCPTSRSIQSSLADLLNSDDEETEDNSSDNKKLLQWKLLINEYNSEKRLEVKGDPLVWWRHNSKYKHLSSIARNYLSAPASSGSIQFVPKESSLISPLKCDGLDDVKSEKLLFVKYNLPLINFDY